MYEMLKGKNLRQCEKCRNADCYLLCVTTGGWPTSTSWGTSSTSIFGIESKKSSRMNNCQVLCVQQEENGEGKKKEEERKKEFRR